METSGITGSATERRQRTPLAVTRERVLGIAERLFRHGGVQSVSVDAIAQAADIKKMTLYRCFASKEDLVEACMDLWEADAKQLLAQADARFPSEPARQVLALFQLVVERVTAPDYTGCPFVHLMTDYPDPTHPLCMRVRAERAALHAALRDRLERAEATDPEQLADTCCLLLEGVLVAARTFGPDSGPIQKASAIAEKLLRQGCGSRAFPPEPRRFRRW